MRRRYFSILGSAANRSDSNGANFRLARNLPLSSVKEVGQFGKADSLVGNTFCREPGNRKFGGVPPSDISEEPAKIKG